MKNETSQDTENVISKSGHINIQKPQTTAFRLRESFAKKIFVKIFTGQLKLLGIKNASRSSSSL